MNLVVEPIIGKKNETLDSPSNYRPEKDVRDRLTNLKAHFTVADTIFSSSYEEFNDRSLIDYQNDCQKIFNNYTEPKSNDPAESWKSTVKRGLSRNKVISIAAHITSTVLYPNIIAQNQEDSQDEEAAMIMRDLMEWSWEESKYARVFINTVIAALVNPAAIIYEGYNEVKRPFKIIKEDGSWKEEEMIDDVYSGFQNLVVPVDELCIGNFYEENIQKQPFLIWKKYIDYEAAKIKYGNNKNFNDYVRPGIRTYYNDSEDTFYEQYDESFEDRLVEEIVYYNRFADLELRIVNGVLLDEPNRPMQRKDKRYPFAKNGYEKIDEGKCFYYKSLIDKLKNDQEVLDKLYELIVNGTYLQVMPPLANFGSESVNSNVIIPGATINFQDPQGKLEPIGTNRDLASGFNALQMVENSANEASQDPMQSGQSPKGSQTAFEIARLEQNAKTILGLYGKSIIELVEDFGELRLKTILEKMPISEASSILSSSGKIKFKSIIVSDREVDGKKKARRIDFTDSEDIENTDVYDLYEEENKKNMSIAKVNVELFKKLNYKVKVNPDFVQPNSKAVQKALNLEAYDRAIVNPLIAQNPEKLAKVTRDFLFKSYVEGKEDEYIGDEMGDMMKNLGMGGKTTNNVNQMANVGVRGMKEAAV